MKSLPSWPYVLLFPRDSAIYPRGKHERQLMRVCVYSVSYRGTYINLARFGP